MAELEPSPPRRPLRAALLERLVDLVELQLSRSDWRGAQAAGRALGRLGWALSRRDRRRAREHLAIAFPELSAPTRARVARASFRHYGTMLAECLWLASRGPAEVDTKVRFDGWERIEAARAARRPILILTGHCGNWELLAAGLNRRGLGMAVVARALEEGALQERLLAFRAHFGSRTIVRGTPGAARALLGQLRAAGALGMLIDQDTQVEGVFVPFFGRLAWTPSGAAELALRFDATVLPTFIERERDGRHLARVEPPLPLEPDVTAATAAMTARIEAQVRRVPEQWVWIHRRWRRRPPGEAQLFGSAAGRGATSQAPATPSR